MRTSRARDERGIALAVAVFALVVIGVLVSGAFFMGRLEQQTGNATLYAAEAAEAAEAGLAYGVQQSDPIVYEALAIYGGNPATDLVYPTQVGAAAGVGDRSAFTTSVRRLSDKVFLVTSVGERRNAAGTPLATATAAQFVRLTKPTFSVNAAVTVTDPIKFNGNSFKITGFNTNPPGWTDCDPTLAGTEDDVVGVRSSSGTGVDKKDDDNIFGHPVNNVPNDPTVTSETFRDFIDQTYATLASSPNVKTLPLTTPYMPAPVVDGAGECDKTNPLNFGEPRRPGVSECYSYLPVVNGTGSLTKFSGGARGQGTLLIDGDLELTGGFEWAGLVIVRGSVKITGTGNKIQGALLAESVTEDNTIGGDVEISYSSCAIAKAVAGSAVAFPLPQRAWVNVY